MRSPGLRQLHMYLSDDAQTHDHDGLSRENTEFAVGMQACGDDLDEWRRPIVDRIRQGVDVGQRSNQIIREPAVRVTPHQGAVRAKAGLAGPAIHAHAAIKTRIDNNALPGLEDAAPAVGYLADHFMAHDQRMTDRDSAFEDVKISAADAAVGQTHQNLIMSRRWPVDLCEAQIARASQDHSFHKRCFGQSAALTPFALPTALLGRVALTTLLNSASVSKRL
jgi:hypothetical protein